MTHYPNLTLGTGSSRPAAPALSREAQPFVDLINTITCGWQDVNEHIQSPPVCITKLHLESLALVRGLHGNLPDPSAPDTPGSSRTHPRYVSPRREQQRRQAKEASGSRLLALEAHFQSMRDQVTQMMTCSQLMFQAAASIDAELECVSEQLERVKAQRAAPQPRRAPSPMSPESSVDSLSEGRSVRSISVDYEVHDATTPDIRDEARSGRTDYFGSWEGHEDGDEAGSTSSSSDEDDEVPEVHPRVQDVAELAQVKHSDAATTPKKAVDIFPLEATVAPLPFTRRASEARGYWSAPTLASPAPLPLCRKDKIDAGCDARPAKKRRVRSSSSTR